MGVGCVLVPYDRGMGKNVTRGWGGGCPKWPKKSVTYFMDGPLSGFPILNSPSHHYGVPEVVDELFVCTILEFATNCIIQNGKVSKVG